MLKNTILFLMGKAVTGKRTIAQEIVKQDKRFQFIHSYDFKEPILRLLPGYNADIPMNDDIYAATKLIRNTIFDAITTFCAPDVNFVISKEMLAGCPRASEFFDALSLVAKQRNARFIPVRLLCQDLEEYLQRGMAEDRTNYLKIRSVDTLTRRFMNSEVFSSNLLTEYSLDVTMLSAQHSAEKILLSAGA